MIYVLAFFSASDGIVNENLCLRFYNDIKAPEARAFYTFQMAMETIITRIKNCDSYKDFAVIYDK